MGHTHNRKRTRSRPGNRSMSALNIISHPLPSFSAMTPPSGITTTTLPPPPRSDFSSIPAVPPAHSLYTPPSSWLYHSLPAAMPTGPAHQPWHHRDARKQRYHEPSYHLSKSWPCSPIPPYPAPSPTRSSATPEQSIPPSHSSTRQQRVTFGHPHGDEDGELCKGMIQVVLDLFDGSVDYED